MSLPLPSSFGVKAGLELGTPEINDEDAQKRRRGCWSPDEDRKLVQAVQDQVKGAQWENIKIQWNPVGLHVGSRTGKQCRERWTNHLHPGLRAEEWKEEEEKMLWELAERYPRKWALISRYLPGRSQNQVKSKYQAISRRLQYESHKSQLLHGEEKRPIVNVNLPQMQPMIGLQMPPNQLQLPNFPMQWNSITNFAAFQQQMNPFMFPMNMRGPSQPWQQRFEPEMSKSSSTEALPHGDQNEDDKTETNPDGAEEVPCVSLP